MIAEALVGSVAGRNKNVLAAASTGVFVIGSSLKAYTRVPHGYLGIRTRWDRPARKEKIVEGEIVPGKRYGIVGPGYRFSVPMSDSIILVSTQEQNHPLNTKIDFNDIGQYAIHASVNWSVKEDEDSVLKAYYRTMNPDVLSDTVADICTEGLYNVMSSLGSTALGNRELVYGELKTAVEPRLDEYGTRLMNFMMKEPVRNIQQITFPDSPQGGLLDIIRQRDASRLATFEPGV
jgi:hypothetical protein